MAPCKFFLQGKCTKGAACTFEHGAPKATAATAAKGATVAKGGAAAAPGGVCKYFVQVLRLRGGGNVLSARLGCFCSDVVSCDSRRGWGACRSLPPVLHSRNRSTPRRTKYRGILYPIMADPLSLLLLAGLTTWGGQACKEISEDPRASRETRALAAGGRAFYGALNPAFGVADALGAIEPALGVGYSIGSAASDARRSAGIGTRRAGPPCPTSWCDRRRTKEYGNFTCSGCGVESIVFQCPRCDAWRGGKGHAEYGSTWTSNCCGAKWTCRPARLAGCKSDCHFCGEHTWSRSGASKVYECGCSIRSYR